MATKVMPIRCSRTPVKLTPASKQEQKCKKRKKDSDAGLIIPQSMKKMNFGSSKKLLNLLEEEESEHLEDRLGQFLSKDA